MLRLPPSLPNPHVLHPPPSFLTETHYHTPLHLPALPSRTGPSTAHRARYGTSHVCSGPLGGVRVDQPQPPGGPSRPGPCTCPPPPPPRRARLRSAWCVAARHPLSVVSCYVILLCQNGSRRSSSHIRCHSAAPLRCATAPVYSVRRISPVPHLSGFLLPSRSKDLSPRPPD